MFNDSLTLYLHQPTSPSDHSTTLSSKGRDKGSFSVDKPLMGVLSYENTLEVYGDTLTFWVFLEFSFLSE